VGAVGSIVAAGLIAREAGSTAAVAVVAGSIGAVAAVAAGSIAGNIHRNQLRAPGY
jgi:hypothetical protein